MKYKKNISVIITVTTLIGVLQACSSISSQTLVYNGTGKDIEDGIEDGVVYFMPKRPIKIIYTIAEDEKDKTKSAVTVSVDDLSVADMIPDTKHMFLLRYNKNYVGKNHMYINIGRNGLLTVTHADTVSRMNEIIKNATRDAAAIGMGAGFVPTASGSGGSTGTPSDGLITHSGKDKNTLNYKDSTNFSAPSAQVTTVKFTTSGKCTPGQYINLIDPDPTVGSIPNINFPGETCGVQIEISRLFSGSAYDSSRLQENNSLSKVFNRLYNWFDLFHMNNTGNSLPGLFYREDKPYRITIKTNEGSEYQMTALSPNESGIYFAPITKTLFSANTSDIFLFNGVIQSLEETTESEIWEASKGPAEFLGEYTSSIGSIFNQLGTNSSNEKSLAENQAALIDKERALGVANATNNLLYAQALAKAQADAKSNEVKDQAGREKEIAEKEQEAKATQAKKQYCDDLLDNANKQTGEDHAKAFDSYFSKCGSKP